MLDRLRVALLKRLDKATTRLVSLEAAPTDQEGLRAKGNVFLQNGHYKEAERIYREVLSSHPNDVKSLVNLGFVLKEQKRLVEARVYLKRAISLHTEDSAASETHFLFGQIAEEQGQLEDARQSFAMAFELNPHFKFACRDLCRVLFLLGKLDAAQEVLTKGLTLHPEYPDFHYYQGNLHISNTQLEEAAQSYSTALALGANNADVHSALGMVQYRLGNKKAAIESLSNAQNIDPSAGAEAQYASGSYFLRYGKPDLAIANFEMAIALRPDFHKAHSILLFTLSFNPTHSTSYTEAAMRYAAMLRAQSQVFIQAPVQHYVRGARPLKVGFVSGDLKAHPVGFFLEGILQEMDPERIVSIAYSNTSNEDQNTAKLRARFGEWHDIRKMNDDDAAQMIRDHQIDILVDLAGHTGENRLPIFIRQPAPVQVTWLGYFASTGLSEIDYVLADEISVPVHSLEFFSEKVWYLPETRLCMTPPSTPRRIDCSPLPAQVNGYVTFGSFQSRSKINQQVLLTWSQVLAAVPGSHLRLQVSRMDDPSLREELLQQLVVAGIPLDKVSLHSGMHWEEYLEAYKHVDILLDTFPYPGGTTTAEALWMGVPTVTLMGDTMLSRQGASMLYCVGLNDWIADSRIDFVAKAAMFAADLPALARLRTELRDRAVNSLLFDTRRFAANLQDCFENMFQRRG